MSTINAKLTAALTAIAILAPVAGAEASRNRTSGAAGHAAISQPERFSAHRPSRHYSRLRVSHPTLELRRNNHNWG